ncbi:MAG TPA: hypothetical protein VEC35_09320 [Noviherbaspirillum sp.]|nr:hypothetical protein [Noviherbaspirillum sp.]
MGKLAIGKRRSIVVLMTPTQWFVCIALGIGGHMLLSGWAAWSSLILALLCAIRFIQQNMRKRFERLWLCTFGGADSASHF